MVYEWLLRKMGGSTTATQLNDNLQKTAKLPVVYYPDLQDVKDIDELFGEKGSFLLMYLKSPTFGHWVLVSKSKMEPLTLEYFDPLGNMIDHYLDEFKFEKGAQYPGSNQLAKLMHASRYKKVMSNGIQLQLDAPEVQTCGKWCMLRYLLLFVPMEQFVDFFAELDPLQRDPILSAMINV